MKKKDINKDKAEDTHKAKLQGQQQGGNHGGGAFKGNSEYGNQTGKNSARTLQQDQDGDAMGRKGKK